MGMIIKDAKCVELNTKIERLRQFNTLQMFMLQEGLPKNILTIMPISLFCCCRKVFTQTNTWISGKNPVNHNHQRKKIFRVRET